MKTMKLRDKKIYLNKLIDYLADNGWDLCNYNKRQFSECDELRSVVGIVVMHEKFDELMDIVGLFDDGKDDEAMDLYNETISAVSDESMFEYYEHVLDDTNPWFV